ncbi:MAG TPA: hypothetical protein VGI33_14990 [Paenibacillus sp.]|jgi:hypothetical protein
MAIYLLEGDENSLGEIGSITSMDIELCNIGNMEFDVYVEGMRGKVGLFSYLYNLGVSPHIGSTIFITNIAMNPEPFSLRIITNHRAEKHVSFQIRMNNRNGDIIRLFTEQQLNKVAD